MVNDNRKFRLEVYRQAWNQSRHNELLRGAFAGVFGVSDAALTSIAPLVNPLWRWLPFAMLLFLSVAGYLLTRKANANSKAWTEVQKKIQEFERQSLPESMDPNNLTGDSRPAPTIGEIFLRSYVVFGIASIGLIVYAVITGYILPLFE